MPNSGNSSIFRINKTVELDIEPTHLIIYTTTEVGYPSIYTNGKVQSVNETVCKITNVNGNKVSFPEILIIKIGLIFYWL